MSHEGIGKLTPVLWWEHFSDFFFSYIGIFETKTQSI